MKITDTIDAKIITILGDHLEHDADGFSDAMLEIKQLFKDEIEKNRKQDMQTYRPELPTESSWEDEFDKKFVDKERDVTGNPWWNDGVRPKEVKQFIKDNFIEKQKVKEAIEQLRKDVHSKSEYSYNWALDDLEAKLGLNK